MPKTVGQLLAADLPVKDDEETGSDLISLCDIVITGIETGWQHFWVHDYDPHADGIETPWAVLTPLIEEASEPEKSVPLTAETVRKAVEVYVDRHIDRGTPLEETRKLMDGSYTDAVIADSILQIALYGEEVYS